jgi:hypothetical protein
MNSFEVEFYTAQNPITPVPTVNGFNTTKFMVNQIKFNSITDCVVSLPATQTYLMFVLVNTTETNSHWLWARRPWFDSRQGKTLVSPAKCPDAVWDPPSFLSNEHRRVAELSCLPQAVLGIRLTLEPTIFGLLVEVELQCFLASGSIRLWCSASRSGRFTVEERASGKK